MAMFHDSSGITVVDSNTTKVTATFNCNYIPTDDLADLLYVLVVKYMPNAIINVERNGEAIQQTSVCIVICIFPRVYCYD